MLAHAEEAPCGDSKPHNRTIQQTRQHCPAKTHEQQVLSLAQTAISNSEERIYSARLQEEIPLFPLPLMLGVYVSILTCKIKSNNI